MCLYVLDKPNQQHSNVFACVYHLLVRMYMCTAFHGVFFRSQMYQIHDAVNVVMASISSSHVTHLPAGNELPETYNPENVRQLLVFSKTKEKGS